MSEAESLLNKGLMAGYAGGETPERIQRGGVEFKVIEGEGGQYRDEWTAGRVGAGQEVATVGDETWTRVYAGGTITEDQLARLGTNKKEVLGRLVGFIVGSEGRTRMFETYESHDGDWFYLYRVTNRIDSRLTIALETINYRGENVFAHGFFLSPVER